MINISDPRTAVSFEEWADDNHDTLADYGYLPKAGDDWLDWSSAVMLMGALTVFNIPDPYQFTDWREWAIRLMQALGAGA